MKCFEAILIPQTYLNHLSLGSLRMKENWVWGTWRGWPPLLGVKESTFFLSFKNACVNCSAIFSLQRVSMISFTLVSKELSSSSALYLCRFLIDIEADLEHSSFETVEKFAYSSNAQCHTQDIHNCQNLTTGWNSIQHDFQEDCDQRHIFLSKFLREYSDRATRHDAHITFGHLLDHIDRRESHLFGDDAWSSWCACISLKICQSTKSTLSRQSLWVAKSWFLVSVFYRSFSRAFLHVLCYSRKLLNNFVKLTTRWGKAATAGHTAEPG